MTHRAAEPTIQWILRAYLMNASRLELRETDLGDPEVLAALRREARQVPTYVALASPLTEEQRLPDDSPLFATAEHVLSGRKPKGELVLDVYRLRDDEGAP